MPKLKVKKITLADFNTNRDMLDKDVLRYVENHYQYLHHIVNYYNESLNDYEKRFTIWLIDRIEFFLKDAPQSEMTYVFVGRYARVLKKLKKLRDEQI